MPKVKNLQGFEWTWFALIFPFGQKSVSTKRADIHLIWKIILIIFSKRLGCSRLYFYSFVSSKLLMMSQLKKIYICSQNYRNICLNCPNQVKLWMYIEGVKSIVDRGGPRANPNLHPSYKWLHRKYQKQP